MSNSNRLKYLLYLLTACLLVSCVNRKAPLESTTGDALSVFNTGVSNLSGVGVFDNRLVFYDNDYWDNVSYIYSYSHNTDVFSKEMEIPLTGDAYNQFLFGDTLVYCSRSYNGTGYHTSVYTIDILAGIDGALIDSAHISDNDVYITDAVCYRNYLFLGIWDYPRAYILSYVLNGSTRELVKADSVRVEYYIDVLYVYEDNLIAASSRYIKAYTIEQPGTLSEISSCGWQYFIPDEIEICNDMVYAMDMAYNPSSIVYKVDMGNDYDTELFQVQIFDIDDLLNLNFNPTYNILIDNRESKYPDDFNYSAKEPLFCFNDDYFCYLSLERYSYDDPRDPFGAYTFYYDLVVLDHSDMGFIESRKISTYKYYDVIKILDDVIILVDYSYSSINYYKIDN